jgi:hypothetical protein
MRILMQPHVILNSVKRKKCSGTSLIWLQFLQVTSPLIHPHMHCHDFSEYANSQQWKIVFDKVETSAWW